MIGNKNTEIAVGLFMLLGLVAMFFLAMQVSNLGSASVGDAYKVIAKFDNIGGLKAKAPVTMAGVEIGRVMAIDFDSTTYQAVVTLGLYPKFDKVPKDTSASILTAGLLGEQYVGLVPGGEEKYLKDGGRIKLTQSALVLEDVIGQFIYSKAHEGAK